MSILTTVPVTRSPSSNSTIVRVDGVGERHAAEVVDDDDRSSSSGSGWRSVSALVLSNFGRRRGGGLVGCNALGSRKRLRSASDSIANSWADRPTALPVSAMPMVHVPAALPSPMPGAVSSTFTTLAAGHTPSFAIAYHIINGVRPSGGKIAAQTVSSGT